MNRLLAKPDPDEAERLRSAAVWEQALPWRDATDVQRGEALADLMTLADAVLASRPDGDEVRRRPRPDDLDGRVRWLEVVRRFHPEAQ